MFFDEDMAAAGAATDAPMSDDGATTDGAGEMPAEDNAGGENAAV